MARGTVRKRSKGSWELRWDEPVGEDGKRKQRSKTYKGTKKLADAELTRIEADLNKSDAERASEMPVEECCRRFLEERSGTDLRPSTVVLYEGFFKNFLVPVCGEIPLARVDRNALQQVINMMIDRGLAASTIHADHAYMKGFFSWAVRAKLLLATPVKGLSLPERSRKSSGQMLSAPEVADVLAVVEGTACWLPAFLGLHTGMRPGEVLGLSWDDVDLVNRILSVRHTLKYSGGGDLRLGPPKTRSSERSVSVSSEVVEVLRERKNPPEFWVPTRGKVGEKFQYLAVPMDFRQVCARPDGGIFSNAAWDTAFRASLRRAGLRKIRLHDLRHTHASLLLLDNVPMHVVQKRLGHASIQTTIDLYGHLLPSSDPEAAARFADIIRMAS